MFILICAVCIPLSGFSFGYLLNEIITRLCRNTFLILCLLIPIMAGMGLSFGMTLGAMAGDWQIWGIPGVIRAMVLSVPISVLLGTICGKLLNSTYNSHSQIGMFCIAALLVGGASVERASIGNVFLGVTLFHLMFIVAPSAGAKITGDSMIGEYFRVFVSYGVITVALTMYEMQKRKKRSRAGQLLQQEQQAEAVRNQEGA